VSTSMVVVPKPAVKGRGALVACAVDGAVGPAGEQGADEALGLSVRLWSVGACAEVADAEQATGERVDARAVGAAVVGEHALDADAVALEERDRPVQEGNRACRSLVTEHLRVGEPAVVVDGDVDVLPADGAADVARAVGEGAVVVLRPAPDAMARRRPRCGRAS
jgi:hypothetical protein